LSTEAVNEKARRLMEPVLGSERSAAVIAQVSKIEDLRDVRELTRHLTL